MNMRSFKLQSYWSGLLAVTLLAGCQATTNKRNASPSAAEAAALAVAEVAKAAPSEHESSLSREPIASGRMGFVCWAAILESISEVGRRCVADEKPAFRAAINKSISEIDSHLRQAGRWSDEQLVSFKSQMGEHTASTEKLCGNNDALQMYRALESAGTAELEKTNASMLAKPGKPEWGACL
jgi:hypothetical protein